MKKCIYIFIAVIFNGIAALAQPATWQVNENSFQYTMTFVAFLNIDGVELSNDKDKVAAFVNGECRGVTNLTYVQSEDKYLAYLTVFSNKNNEVINFTVYDALSDKVIEIEKTINFSINEHQGNLFQAFSIANPVLNNEADILAIGLEDVNINDTVFNEAKVTLYLNQEQDLTELKPLFTLSPGAELFVSNVRQETQGNSMDFSNDIQFQVRSEDQSLVKTWVVSAKSTVGVVTYYKKDAVCYTKGVIKIVYSGNGTEVVLTKDNAAFATQTIINGEAIFSDLESGTYVVNVAGDTKEITVNFKE